MADSSEAPGLFSELRRRKVFRAVAAYAALAFILLQVAELTFPAYEVPDWIYTAVVTALGLGFPVVMVLAWVFEWTPGGLRPETPASHLLPVAAEPTAMSGPIDSLAVLPFRDHSPTQDQEYFVDGMTQALIGKLARIEGMRVISRTSVMRFRNSELPLQDIARQLQVRALVEGSVVRVGERVRIEAQLIDASNDDHLWAESYEGEIADILSLQSDVALTTAQAIRETLTQSEQQSLSATPDVDPEAYNLYLKGLHEWNKCTAKHLEKAARLFKAAVDVDPDCALAYSGLADAYSMLMFYNAMSGQEALPLVREAAQRAIDLDPTLAEAHCSLAWAHLWDWNFEASEAGFRRALKLNPNYANARHWYGNLLCFLGRGEESVEQMLKAKRVDPLSAQIANSTGWTYYVLRRYDEAIEELEHTLRLDPEFANAFLLLSLNHLEQGRKKKALACVERAIELDPGQPEYELFRAYVQARIGDLAAARDTLRNTGPRTDLWARRAIVHIALGEHEMALEELERALDEQPWTVLNLKLYPWYDPLRGDPRFEALVEKLGLD